jgi:xanthine dehydrogenase YagS FAD-binding subunit
MKSFEYVSPGSVGDAVRALGTTWGPAEILAGGTDLVALMKDYAVTPDRLVNIKKIRGLDSTTFSPSKGLTVGALVTLDQLANDQQVTRNYPALASALADAASPQIRNRATIGGNLCQRPRCWYFRNGYGLLAVDGQNKSLVLRGENRYHAILGNDGPAYFVSPSTIAPTLIALGAVITLQGGNGTRDLPLGNFYVTPTRPDEREHNLLPNEVLIGVRVPPPGAAQIAYYEIRQKHGFDWPIATATAVLSMDGQKVGHSTLMLSHVAPIPWRCTQAEAALTGRAVTFDVARAAADAELKNARSLGQNGYKIQVARTALARAVLQAAGIDPLTEGGR